MLYGGDDHGPRAVDPEAELATDPLHQHSLVTLWGTEVKNRVFLYSGGERIEIKAF